MATPPKKVRKRYRPEEALTVDKVACPLCFIHEDKHCRACDGTKLTYRHAAMHFVVHFLADTDANTETKSRLRAFAQKMYGEVVPTEEEAKRIDCRFFQEIGTLSIN